MVGRFTISFTTENSTVLKAACNLNLFSCLGTLGKEEDEEEQQGALGTDTESMFASSLESEFHKSSKIERISECISNGHTILIDSSNVLEALREFAIVHTIGAEDVT